MNEEIKNLINDLQIDDQSKQELLAALDQHGPTQALMERIKEAVKHSEDDIRMKYPNEIKELEDMYKDANQKMDQAYQQFSKEMDKIDDDAAKIYQDTSKQLDKVEMDQARGALKE